jgi:2-hydroxymuconate-semialdehyde hydrolase
MSVTARPESEERGRPLAAAAARQRMLAGIPLAERRLKVGGVSTAVLEGGDGPPLVLLHGGIECGGAIWAPVVSHLVESNRVIVPDLPGLGESEPVPRLDAAAFARWLAELVEATCSEEPTLVVHSLAGSLAARFAAEHGALLRRAVIYASPGIGPYRMPLRLRVVAIRFAVQPTERSFERFARFALLDLDRTRARDPEWFEAFSRYTLSRAAVPHVKRTMRHLVKTCTKQVPDIELRRIAIPTTLLWGGDDRMAPLGLARDASARLGWPLHVIDAAAHVPHLEQPQGFLRALGPALAGVERSTTETRGGGDRE